MDLKAVHHADWLLNIFMICVILIVAARFYNPRKFRQFALLPFQGSDTDRAKEFKPFSRNLFDVILAIYSYIVVALMLTLIGVGFESGSPNLSEWSNFVRFFLVLIIFFLAKDLLELTVGWVFRITEQIAFSQTLNLAYRAWASIYLLPLSFLVVYIPNSYTVGWWIIVILLSGSYLVAIWQSTLILWKLPISAYYKILYLCALEIVPILFLISWL